MQHIENRHNLTDEQLQTFVDNINNVEYAYLDNKKSGSYGGRSVLVKINTPKGKIGSAFEILPNGRTFIKTAFFNTDANIDNWAKKEGSSTSLLDESSPSNFTVQPSFIDIIKEKLGVVNKDEYYQTTDITQEDPTT